MTEHIQNNQIHFSLSKVKSQVLSKKGIEKYGNYSKHQC